MIAQYRFISVHISSWRMSESAVKGKIKGYWLKADVCVWIFFSDACDYAIVKGLKLKPFSYTGKEQKGVANGVSNEWFIDEFISNDVGVASEGFCYLLPVFNKLFM